jgi:uncharacterized phiE125 gp8 family phage protein
MINNLIVPPTSEPVTLDEFKLQLNGSSGTIADNSTLNTCIPVASYPIDYELMTCDVAPTTAWEVGDTITGQTSLETCEIVTVLTTKVFIVKSRSGDFTLGEIIGVTGDADKLADQGAAYPRFITTYDDGYMVLGEPVEVSGHTAVVYLRPVDNGVGGTVDAKIKECDTSTGTFTDWSGGAFTQVTEANDTVQQEITYTGAKTYIRVVAKPLVAASEFGADIMVWEPLSSEDTMMLEDIETARRDVENDTRRAILTQTWDYHIQKWPSADRIKMPLGNLQSVTSIKWKSTDGTETTLTEGTDYLVETNGDRCGYIVLPYNGSWPSGTLYPSNPITITYVCGWTSAALVPTTIKRAIKSRAVNYYMNRGDDIVGYHMVTRDITYDRLINNVPPLWDEDFI